MKKKIESHYLMLLFLIYNLFSGINLYGSGSYLRTSSAAINHDSHTNGNQGTVISISCQVGPQHLFLL